MTWLSFEKWQGAGNDFIVVDADAAALDDAAIRWLCDRRFGVGADGVLIVEKDHKQSPRMIVRNADASRPEMCGNGLRCVVAYELGKRRQDEGILEVATDAGLRRCELKRGAGGASTVTVEMGSVRRVGDLSVELEGATRSFARYDVGNPHAVTFDAFDEAAIERWGPRTAASVPEGTNVEFCVGRGDRFDVVVWERGVGRTLACGTGACAVAFAACEMGRASFGEPVAVGLPGGDLVVTLEKETGRAILRGPAQRVYLGEVKLA